MAPFSPFPRARPRGKNCGGTAKKQVVKNSPCTAPWTRPATRQEGRGYKLSSFYAGRMMSIKSLLQLEKVGARFEQSRPGKEQPFAALVLFFTRFLASTLAS